ncbi:unnamed protein product [Amoebophrya sp. A120]|nr:unnamed protein product [Amoebophrya sp. A120]|eukprot:GSA120T00002749001.1
MSASLSSICFYHHEVSTTSLHKYPFHYASSAEFATYAITPFLVFSITRDHAPQYLFLTKQFSRASGLRLTQSKKYSLSSSLAFPMSRTAPAFAKIFLLIKSVSKSLFGQSGAAFDSASRTCSHLYLNAIRCRELCSWKRDRMNVEGCLESASRNALATFSCYNI